MLAIYSSFYITHSGDCLFLGIVHRGGSRSWQWEGHKAGFKLRGNYNVSCCTLLQLIYPSLSSVSFLALLLSETFQSLKLSQNLIMIHTVITFGGA